MKAPKYFLKPTHVLIIFSLVLFASCSSVSNEEETLSDEDIEAASQILAESLSDDESGVMSNMYDAMSKIDMNGIHYGNAYELNKYGDDNENRIGNRNNNRNENQHQFGNNGRGAEHDYNYSYDPETGIHTISFVRSVSNPNFSKEVSVLHKIIYTDLDGSFIEFPGENREQIEEIYFIGNKSGFHNGPVRSAVFSRVDTMNYTGLATSSTIFTMDGKHYGEGSAEINSPNVTASKDYNVYFDFDNIEIDKATVLTNGTLEEGVTGTLTYEIVIIEDTPATEPTERTLEGEIEFVGDGTALLRFKHVQRIFRIYLTDGLVNEIS